MTERHPRGNLIIIANIIFNIIIAKSYHCPDPLVTSDEERYRVVSFNFQKFLYESIEDPIKIKDIKY